LNVSKNDFSVGADPIGAGGTEFARADGARKIAETRPIVAIRVRITVSRKAGTSVMHDENSWRGSPGKYHKLKRNINEKGTCGEGLPLAGFASSKK
jgi:hypothetical protein